MLSRTRWKMSIIVENDPICLLEAISVILSNRIPFNRNKKQTSEMDHVYVYINDNNGSKKLIPNYMKIAFKCFSKIAQNEWRN